MPSFGRRRALKQNKTIKSMQNHPDIANQQFQANQEFKQVYMCSCGKQYLSFPATYLHFREKHDIKLSTRPTEKRKIVQIEGNIKKITYSIEIQNNQKSIDQQNNLIHESPPTNSKNPQLNVQVKNIQNCVTRYLGVSNKKSKELYQKLIQYLNYQSIENKQEQITVKIEKVPLFLNDFTLIYLPKCQKSLEVGSIEWKQCCIELKEFCDWLRTQKYTDLIVLLEKV